MSFKSIIKKLFITNEWYIGVVEQSVDNLMKNEELSKINWLSKATNVDYHADPFFFDDSSIIFEEFDIKRGYGEIKLIDFNGNYLSLKGDLNKIPAHQSFPFIFYDQAQKYCIPEMSEYGEIRLYKIINNNIVFNKILIPDFPGVDTNIIFHNDRVWLLTSHNDEPGSLYIFYSNSLFDEFKAHILNPVYKKNSISRNGGGVFEHDNDFYRPVQSCIKSYGEALLIKKVISLTENEYVEEDCFNIYPQSPFNEGIHTLNYQNGKFLVDGRSSRFLLTNPIRKLMKVLNIKLKTKLRKKKF